MSSNNYDGLDIDWEPLAAADILQYTNFMTTLRAAIPGAMLTAAAPAYPQYGDPPDAIFAVFASLQGTLDQINIMTYDLSGPYPGWITWFNSPIYDGGYTFPSTGGPLPSIDGAVDNYVNNGVNLSSSVSACRFTVMFGPASSNLANLGARAILPPSPRRPTGRSSLPTIKATPTNGTLCPGRLPQPEQCLIG